MQAKIGIGALISVLLLLHPGEGIINNATVTLQRETIQGLYRFGFLPGGTAYFSASILDEEKFRNAYLLTAETGGLYFLLCNNRQLTEVYELHENICDPASELAEKCGWHVKMTAETSNVVYSKEVQHHLGLNFLYLNCYSESFTASIVGEFINPHSEQLPSGEIPLKLLVPSYLIPWVSLEALWWCNILKHKEQNAQLQLTMSIVPAFAVLKLALWSKYWDTFSRRGFVPYNVYIPAFLVSGLSRAALFAALLIIARGWKITRHHLTNSDWKTITIMSFAYAMSFWAWSSYSSFFFLFMMVMIYVMLLRYIFGAITDNMLLLLYQLHVIREAGMNPEDSTFWAQLIMYRSLRSALIVYICLDVLFRIWGIIALQDAQWIQFILEETCSIVLTYAVGHTFRLQHYSPYYNQVDEYLERLALFPAHVYTMLSYPQLFRHSRPGSVNSEHIPLLHASLQRTLYDGQMFSPAQRTPGASPLRRSSTSFVVIQNPSTVDNDGNEILNVSVGKQLE